jgi:hypothetical protein
MDEILKRTLAFYEGADIFKVDKKLQTFKGFSDNPKKLFRVGNSEYDGHELGLSVRPLSDITKEEYGQFREKMCFFPDDIFKGKDYIYATDRKEHLKMTYDMSDLNWLSSWEKSTPEKQITLLPIYLIVLVGIPYLAQQRFDICGLTEVWVDSYPF